MGDRQLYTRDTGHMAPERSFREPSAMQQGRRDIDRRNALGIAYAFLGTAGNFLAKQWPSRSEQMSPEVYNQVIAEIKAHGEISGEAKVISNRAKQAFEETYSDIGRGPDHTYVQPNIHEAYGYRPETQPLQQSRYQEAGPRLGEASGSRRRLDALSDKTYTQIRTPDEQSFYSETYSFRIAYAQRLTPEEMEAPGIHFKHVSGNELEIHIPREAVLNVLPTLSLSRQIKETLEKYDVHDRKINEISFNSIINKMKRGKIVTYTGNWSIRVKGMTQQ